MRFGSGVAMVSEMPEGPTEMRILLEPFRIRHFGKVQIALDQGRLLDFYCSLFIVRYFIYVDLFYI